MSGVNNGNWAEGERCGGANNSDAMVGRSDGSAMMATMCVFRTSASHLPIDVRAVQGCVSV